MKEEVLDFSNLKNFNSGMNGNGILVNETEINIELNELVKLLK